MEDLFMVIGVVGMYLVGACLVSVASLLFVILEENNWRKKKW
jgi:hypothetical protein